MVRKYRSTSWKCRSSASPRLVPLWGRQRAERTSTPKSRRVVPLSLTAEGLLREVRANQRVERLRAGSIWQPTPYVFTTELGEPCDPRNALRALKAAAKRAGCLRRSGCTHWLGNLLGRAGEIWTRDPLTPRSGRCGCRAWTTYRWCPCLTVEVRWVQPSWSVVVRSLATLYGTLVIANPRRGECRLCRVCLAARVWRTRFSGDVPSQAG